MTITKHNFSGRKPWRLFGVLPCGKRVLQYHASRENARAAWSNALGDAADLGAAFSDLTPDVKRRLAEAHRRSVDAGYTLEDAHNAIMAQRAAFTARRIPTGVAVEKYLARLTERGLRPAYVKTHTNRLRQFVAAFDGDLCDVTGDDLQTWIDSRDLSPRSIKNVKNDLRTFYRWAVRKNYALNVAPDEIEIPREDEREPGIVPVGVVEEFFRRLKNAAPEHVPFFTIGFFIGARPDEIRRLDWSSVRFDDGLLTMAAVATKGRRRRVVPLEQNAAEWLDWSSSRGGIMPDAMSNRPFNRIRRDCGIRAAWSNDCMRHSCVSFRLARGDDERKVQADIGHSSRETIWSHYRALVERVEADRFWRIRP